MRPGRGVSCSPVNAIYKLDLRSGCMRFMDIAYPTARGIEHEIITLKRQNKQDLRCPGAGVAERLLAEHVDGFVVEKS